MWAKRLSGLTGAFLVLSLLVPACQGRTDTRPPVVSRGPGAASPESAVRDLVNHLNSPDFAAASDLALPNHAALASLAEGATFREVANALGTGDSAVASNFWAGFAQGAGSFLTGTVTTVDGEVVTQDNVEFHSVVVIAESGADREMLVRESDGYRVDLFASFGSALADKMIPQVERLLAAQTDDARLILGELRSVVPSLLVAASRPGMSPDSVQHLLRLVELITRVG